MACGMLMTLMQPELNAQNADGVYHVALSETRTSNNDTLLINLPSGNKMQLICRSFERLKAYAAGDSVKTLFINDIENARKAGTLSADARNVFYFIHQNTTRRVKAENPEYTDNSVDPGYEITRLNQALPKYEYHIYDLPHHVQINIYLEDPELLKEVLGGFSINDAIKQVSVNHKTELKKSYKVEVDANNGSYQFKSRTQGQRDMLELSPLFGVQVLGNTIGPLAGIDMTLRFTNKYTIGTYKIGLGINAFSFVNSVGGEVSGVSFVRSYEARFMYNFGNNLTVTRHWVGLKVGYMNSEIKSFNNRYKLGFVTEGPGDFTYSFDYIYNVNKNPVYGLSILKTF